MKNAILGLALLAASGCATQTFTLQSGGPEEPTEETRQNFFVSGIGQSKMINAATVCGGAEKVAKVEVIQQPLDGVLGFITAGIYTPRTARVFCAS